jgi:uridine kinase
MRNFVWGGGESSSSTKPLIIGCAGGTASGKTSVCKLILDKLGDHRVAIISQDCFYKNLTTEEKEKAKNKNYNFDHPDAFDWELMEKVLRDLTEGKPVKVPTYDFVTHSRTEQYTSVCAVDIVIMEGILIFYKQDLLDLMSIKLFVEADADTRLARRILRDIKSRGRDLESVLTQYQKFVKPAFEQYILPTKTHADVIIPRGAENQVAIDLIVQHIRTKLDEKQPFRKDNIKVTVPLRAADDNYLTFGIEL